MNESFFAERGLYYRINTFKFDRQTIVFVHGLSGSSSAWRQYEDFFEPRYNVVTFDLRGHGKSVRFPDRSAYALQHFVDDIQALLDHLQISKCVMVSHSFGSLIAIDFVLSHQERLLGAVFLSPNVAVSRRWSARLVRPFVRAAGLLLGLFPWPVRPGGHIDYIRYQGTGDWNLRRTWADVYNTGLRVYLYCTYHAYAFDRKEVLSQITIPVLIMHGKNDTIFPVENARIAAKLIPHATLVLIDHADHILVLNHFSEVSQAIQNFLTDRAL